jgi:flagellar motor switch protein FliN
MADILSIDDVAKALTEELATACGARLGGDATSAPADVPAAAGWTLTLPISGAVEGQIIAWYDTSSALAYAKAVSGADSAPSDVVIGQALGDLTHDAMAAVQARPDCANVKCGAPTIGQGKVPAGARACFIAVPNTASCLLAVGVEPAVAAPVEHDRLGAVLNVDLPLVVRFGRTVMPLRAVADLGPGSVIDMGRSPEEPVDLLVGERIIARGEVVVVGGNYGVRITQLASGREIGAKDREARAI